MPRHAETLKNAITPPAPWEQVLGTRVTWPSRRIKARSKEAKGAVGGHSTRRILTDLSVPRWVGGTKAFDDVRMEPHGGWGEGRDRSPSEESVGVGGYRGLGEDFLGDDLRFHDDVGEELFVLVH